MRSHAIAWNRMRSHAIAWDRMRSHEIANLMSTTVWVLENAPGTRSGTESLPKVFLHNNCEQISLLFFSPFSKRKKWEAGIILHSKTCFFCSQLSWRNTSGRIFSQCYVCKRCWTTFICCGCAYGCVPTKLRSLTPTKLVEFCYKSGQVSADVWWWNEVIEAVYPTHIHLTSILYI